MANWMEKSYQYIRKEWEIVLLGISGFLLFTVLVWAFWESLELWYSTEKTVPVRVQVPDLFAPWAFNFLKPTRASSLPPNHAFSAQVPEVWIQQLERKAMIERIKSQQEQMAKTPNAPATPNLPGPSAQPARTPPAPPPPPPPPPPNPPIRHCVTFKGFYQSTSGNRLAFLAYQDFQEQTRVDHPPKFLSVNDKIGDYTIQEITNDKLILKNEQGDIQEVLRDQLFEYGKTENPPSLLKSSSSGSSRGDSSVSKNIPLTREQGRDFDGIKESIQTQMRSITPEKLKEWQEKLKISADDLEKLLKK